MSFPLKTRIRFALNGMEISDLVLEMNQTALVEVVPEIFIDDEWVVALVENTARLVSSDGEEIIEWFPCPVSENIVEIDANVETGSYFLEVCSVFFSPIELERVQRLKVKVVVDRK